MESAARRLPNGGRTRRKLWGTVASAIALTAGMVVGGSPPAGATSPAPEAPWPSGNWVSTINYYRAKSGLPPVVKSLDRSTGAAAHAKYQVLNNVLSATEDPAKPGYSAAGSATAAVANLAGASVAGSMSAEDDVESLFTAPRSAVSLLEPDLETVGYGSYKDSSKPGYKWSSVLDVGDLSGDTSGVTFPILFPGDGAKVPLTKMDTSEQSDVLDSCDASYSSTKDDKGLVVVGPPLIVMWAPDADPDVTGSTFALQGGGALDHCRVDEDSVVFVIPKAPLEPGNTYNVSVTADGTTKSWSFSVSRKPPYWKGWDIVRGVAGHDGFSGHMVDGWGGVHPFGVTKPMPAGPYWKGWDIVRGATIKNDKGYLVDGWGGLHKLGSAPNPSGGPYWPGWDIARGVDAKSDLAGGVVADGWGGLHKFGNTSGLSLSGAPYWVGWDIVRDVALNPSGPGGWTLDGWGGLHAWGGAPAAHDGPYWGGWDIARGLKIDADGEHGTLVDAWGGLHSFEIG